MAEIIDGKEVAKNIKNTLKTKIKDLKDIRNITPGLATILVGNNPASKQYVKMKKITAEKLGMNSYSYKLEENAPNSEVLDIIQNLNGISDVHGILLQLPLPKHLREDELIGMIDSKKDVDCLTPYNIGNLVLGRSYFKPCTPKGILSLLDHYEIETSGKNVVIVGRSKIVGRPLSIMMSDKERNATVTLCHSRTKNLEKIARTADILIAAIGKPNFIDSQHVKEKAVVIDVGVNKIDDSSAKKGYRLVGDVDYLKVKDNVSYITPVPGGVGPMTIVSLMQNTYNSARSSRI